MKPRKAGRLWVVSELYYPEKTSTGHILTRIAEGLAAKHRVHVVCGQPTYSARGLRAPKRESRNGVEIERCWATTWNKDVLLKRFVNMLTITCSFFLHVLARLRRNETVLVVTNPPVLPFLVTLACWVRGARCILLIHDKYPEAAVAAGLLRPNSLLTWTLRRCSRRLYRSVESIVVVGRDMRELVQKQSGRDDRRVAFIPNWADLDTIHPQHRSQSRILRRHGLSDKFVVQCAGNMGRLQDIESLAKCADVLRGHPEIHFLVIGSGAKKAWLERTVQESGLGNVTLLPPFPREASEEFLNACDLSISVFVPGMLGVSVPSRAYNILAAGKPIVAVTDRDSELGRIVNEEDVGWVTPPGDVPAMARAILEAHDQPEALAAMGRRARLAAETKYRLDQVLDAFTAVIDKGDT